MKRAAIASALSLVLPWKQRSGAKASMSAKSDKQTHTTKKQKDHLATVFLEFDLIFDQTSAVSGFGAELKVEIENAESTRPSTELDRYCRLLATVLTDLEREFLDKRIAKERFKLERLEAQANSNTAMAFIAAQAFAKGGRSHT